MYHCIEKQIFQKYVGAIILEEEKSWEWEVWTLKNLKKFISKSEKKKKNGGQA